MNPHVRGWRWNRAHNALVADVEVLGGGNYEVRFPVAQVARDYAQVLGDCGCTPEEVGFVDVIGNESVDGFLSKIRHAASRTVHHAVREVTHPKAIPFEPHALRKARRRVMGKRLRGLERRYTHTASRAAALANKAALRVGRSKQLGAGLGIAATAFPAVGGPALGAWVAANQYARYHDQAQQVVRSLGGHTPSPHARRIIKRGMHAKQAFKRLRFKQDDPRARLLLGALRSM